jgi:hypothetical protein
VILTSSQKRLQDLGETVSDGENEDDEDEDESDEGEVGSAQVNDIQ